MSVSTTLKETTAEARKPLFAVVGAGDFAVEQVQALPTEAKKAQAELTAKARELQAAISDLPGSLKTARTAVEGKVSELTGRAGTVYAELAVRGERLVTAIRKQPATEAVAAESKSAVRQAKGATTSARKATKAAEKAVEDAAEKIG